MAQAPILSITAPGDSGQPAFRALVERAWRWRDTLTPLAIALGMRALVFVVATSLTRWVIAGHFAGASYPGPMAAWARKDANWYLMIARTGYQAGPMSYLRPNFFPLYPALIALFAPIARALGLPLPYLLSGMAISWLAFAGACVALYRLALLRFDRRVATITTLLVATYPFSFYFGAAFSEAIYLLLAVGVFLAIERRSWWVAGGLAALAGAVRPPGLLLGACVALAYGLMWLRERRLRWDALALALTPLGTLAYLLACWIWFGNPLAYLTASRQGWHSGLQLTGTPEIWIFLRDPVRWFTPIDLTRSADALYLLLAVVFLAFVPLVWRRLGPVYAIFVMGSILAPLFNFPTLHSLGRYLSVDFAVFIVLATLLRDRLWLAIALSAGALVSLLYFAACFTAGLGLS